MSDAPSVSIDPKVFWKNPYPDLARMRASAPVAFVPELGATLITRRDDIFNEEKRIEVFSSDQPEGLLTKIMGPNMMRKDGAAHHVQRRALFPAVSPKTVRDHWEREFRAIVKDHIDRLLPEGGCDLVKDFALPVAADALRLMLGLPDLAGADLDRCSQAMLDGAANYTRDPKIAATAHAAAAEIDGYIDARLPALRSAPDLSILSVLDQAGVPLTDIRGNVKVIIGGGQNEPRDAIAGTAWALLSHPNQLGMIREGQASWRQAFDEYLRWISPISMSPRRVAKDAEACGVAFEKNETVFFMFGSGNRDERVFDAPGLFDITRDTSAAVAFGAGPHFCAGAAASRSLIADVALPMLFDALPGLRLDGEVPFGGWAFRGPLKMPVAWG